MYEREQKKFTPSAHLLIYPERGVFIHCLRFQVCCSIRPAKQKEKKQAHDNRQSCEYSCSQDVRIQFFLSSSSFTNTAGERSVRNKKKCINCQEDKIFFSHKKFSTTRMINTIGK